MSDPSNPLDSPSIKQGNKKLNSPSLKKSQKKLPAKNKTQSKASGIPKKIANRMARRIAITTGLPTISGMGVFVGSYLIVSKGIAEIPPGITLISSALCFLTGLVGLSYGILSASWDDAPGTIFGFKNIRPNIQRMRDAFKVDS